MGILDDITNSLTSDGQLTPAGQGLLAAGLGILAHNRGLTSGAAAIGLGGQQGLATFQGAQQAQLARQLGQQQLIQAQLQNRMLGGKIDFATGAQPGAQGAGAAPPQTTPNALAPLGGMGTTPTSMQGLAQSAAAQAPQQAAQQPAQAQNPFAPGGSFNPLGLDEQTARGMFLYDPNYAKNFVAPAYAPTDAQRAARASGLQMGTPEYQSYMQDAATKQNYIAPVSGRPGGYLAYANGQQEQLPHVPDGFTAVRDQSGQWNIVPVPGAIDAVSASQAAQARGKGQYKLTQVYDPQTQQMVYQTETNVADAAGGATPGNPSLPAPIRNNNPGALMPGGKLAQYGSAQEGLAAMDSNLQNYGKQGVNTLAGVISKWAPPNENDTRAYIADAAQRLGIKPDQKIDLSNPYVRQAIGSAIMLRENGPSGVFGYPGQQGTPTGAGSVPQGYPGAPGGSTPPARSGAFSAGAPLGVTQGAQVMAQKNADQYSSLKDLASTSGDRINTLDNMLELANGATKFGPGWDQRMGRIAKLNGYLPSDIQLGSDDAANAQILQKYMSNLAQQYQKALGGQGTDAQLATVLKGTPTPDMLNKAMVEVIPKLKAQELALQAKANGADAWLAKNNNNPANFNQFENFWRQNYDPRIYQMQQMTTNARKDYMSKQPDAGALRNKVTTALQNGWIQ